MLRSIEQERGKTLKNWIEGDCCANDNEDVDGLVITTI